MIERGETGRKRDVPSSGTRSARSNRSSPRRARGVAWCAAGGSGWPPCSARWPPRLGAIAQITDLIMKFRAVS